MFQAALWLTALFPVILCFWSVCFLSRNVKPSMLLTSWGARFNPTIQFFIQFYSVCPNFCTIKKCFLLTRMRSQVHSLCNLSLPGKWTMRLVTLSKTRQKDHFWRYLNHILSITIDCSHAQRFCGGDNDKCLAHGWDSVITNGWQYDQPPVMTLSQVVIKVETAL